MLFCLPDCRPSSISLAACNRASGYVAYCFYMRLTMLGCVFSCARETRSSEPPESSSASCRTWTTSRSGCRTRRRASPPRTSLTTWRRQRSCSTSTSRSRRRSTRTRPTTPSSRSTETRSPRGRRTYSTSCSERYAALYCWESLQILRTDHLYARVIDEQFLFGDVFHARWSFPICITHVFCIFHEISKIGTDHHNWK